MAKDETNNPVTVYGGGIGIPIEMGSYNFGPTTLMANVLGGGSPTPRSRKIFVAYPYSFPKTDYRRPFTDLAKVFDVELEYADAKITNRQILGKITDMIMAARFSLFDVTTWNANVALELGIAIGRGRDYYLLFNPGHPGNPRGEVPADLGGLDRIQYGAYSELEDGLTALLLQEFGLPTPEEKDPLREYRESIVPLLTGKPGLKIGEIADELGTAVEIAKVVVKPLVPGVVETTGVKKGTRYYLSGRAPKPRPSLRPAEETTAVVER